MVPFFFRGLVTTSDDLTEKDWSKANLKMADCVEGLRNLVLGKIESISRILVGPSQMSHVQDTVEKIDQIAEAINCLASVTRLLEDVYRDLSILLHGWL